MRMKRVIRYLILNIAFATSIYFGLYKGHENAANIAYFVAWFSIVISFLCGIKEVQIAMQKKYVKWIRHVDIVFDICVVLAFVYFGATVTGVFYMLHMLMIEVAYGTKHNADECDE